MQATSEDEDLLIKIGIHEGPCLAVTLNDRQDYFGQTVNIAARVQGLADARAIFATKPVVENPQVAKMLEAASCVPTEQLAALRGVADKMAVFQNSVEARHRQNVVQSPDRSNAALAR